MVYGVLYNPCLPLKALHNNISFFKITLYMECKKIQYSCVKCSKCVAQMVFLGSIMTLLRIGHSLKCILIRDSGCRDEYNKHINI